MRTAALIVGWAAATAAVAAGAIGVGRAQYDRRMQNRARTALHAVPGATGVRVVAHGHSLVLRGRVADASAHLQAVAAVRRLSGVTDVADHLVVTTVASASTEAPLVVSTLPVPPLVPTGVPVTVAVTRLRSVDVLPDAPVATLAPLALDEAQRRLDQMLTEPLRFTARGPTVITGLTLDAAADLIGRVETSEIEIDLQPLAGAPRAQQLIAALRDRGADTPRWTPVSLQLNPSLASVRIVLKAPIPVETTLVAADPIAATTAPEPSIPRP